MPEYRAGDAGNARWFFPGHTKYATVKLHRAASDDSKLVRDWLNSNSFWNHDSRSDIKVKLYDSTGMIVIVEWELRAALPKKWSINNMDAGASQISIETLEIDHEGFLEDEVKIGEVGGKPGPTSWS
jgi:phage tail-like protein